MKTALPVSIIMADDHPLYRNGFKNIVLSQYANEVIFLSEVENGARLLEAVTLQQPDVVFTDVQMPEMDGVEACKKIKTAFPDIGVIALSMFSDPVHIMSMLKAGANGYLSKTSDHEEIIDAIRTVSNQKNYYCSTISEKLFGNLINSNQQRLNKHVVEFGAQEKMVVQLICKQLTTKEIAAKMRLADKTIEHYRQNIQEKIGARNVVGIALYAAINGIVRLNEIATVPS